MNSFSVVSQRTQTFSAGAETALYVVFETGPVQLSIDRDRAGAQLDRPCLEYHIKRCLGPCAEGLCTLRDYRKAVDDVILLLEGKNEQLILKLTEKMKRAAEEEHFEAAAFFRDRIQLVRDLAERQKMASTDEEDIDVFAYYREGIRLTLQLFTLRGGRVVGKREFYWEDLQFFDPGVFLRDAIQQYYLNNRFVPHQIFLPCEIEDQDLISRWLSEKKRRTSRKKVHFLVPKQGEKLNLLMLVERNAKIAFEARFKISRSERLRTLDVLQHELGLPQTPSRIEAFDISNIQGTDPVASMVVCLDGTMNRKEYRRFKIRSVSGPNDFEAMHEVVFRRYHRLLEERQELPQMVLVDGGKGQLHYAYQALSELEIEDLPLASIAKREEYIYVQGQEDPIILEGTSPALHLIQEIRDEAHRFAVTYHRKRRNLRSFGSELDQIPGIGQKRKKRLLQNFGSLSRIRRASVEELIPYLGQKLAQTVHGTLNDSKRRDLRIDQRIIERRKGSD